MEAYGAVTLNASQVVDNLVQCAAGQIVACNVLAGVEHQLVGRAWAKEMLAWIGRLGSYADYASPEKLVVALQDLQTGRLSPTVPPQDRLPDIRLRGDATPSPFQVEVSCVVRTDVLQDIVSHADKLRLRREGLAWPSSPAEFMANSTISEWRDKPASVRTVRFEPSKSLGRAVAWFTRRDDLMRATASVKDADRAQRTRDVLGLVHHKAGKMLAALHFPPATLSGVASARPTFADATSHRRFKTWPDGPGARRRRHWGTTADLEAFDAADTSIDGCRERVTRGIIGATLGDGRFEFELLGSVRASVGTGEAADTTFAARLTEGRTMAQIAQELKAL